MEAHWPFSNAETKNVFSSACLPIPVPPNTHFLKGKYENYDECRLPQSWQPLIAATLGGDKKFAAATEPKNWFPRPLDLADDYPDTAPKRKENQGFQNVQHERNAELFLRIRT